MQNRRINIRLPTGISTSHFHLHTCHRETRLQAGSQIFLHAITRAASQNLNSCFSSTNRNNSKIGRSLYRIRNSRNHTGHTVLTSKDCINQIVLNLFRHLTRRKFHTFSRKADRCFNCRIFFIEQVFAVFHQAQ